MRREEEGKRRGDGDDNDTFLFFWDKSIHFKSDQYLLGQNVNIFAISMQRLRIQLHSLISFYEEIY